MGEEAAKPAVWTMVALLVTSWGRAQDTDQDRGIQTLSSDEKAVLHYGRTHLFGQQWNPASENNYFQILCTKKWFSTSAERGVIWKALKKY